MGDLVMAARHRLAGSAEPTRLAAEPIAALPVQDAITRYALALDVADAPGVLARIAQVFADHGVSIEAMRQNGHLDGAAELRIITHAGTQRALDATVAAVNELDVVTGITSVMRVEGN